MCDIAAVAKLPVKISKHNTDISLNVILLISSEQTTNSETCTMNIEKHCCVMNRNNTLKRLQRQQFPQLQNALSARFHCFFRAYKKQIINTIFVTILLISN